MRALGQDLRHADAVAPAIDRLFERRIDLVGGRVAAAHDVLAAREAHRDRRQVAEQVLADAERGRLGLVVVLFAVRVAEVVSVLPRRYSAPTLYCVRSSLYSLAPETSTSIDALVTCPGSSWR
jgi:hypothetical protein